MFKLSIGSIYLQFLGNMLIFERDTKMGELLHVESCFFGKAHPARFAEVSGQISLLPRALGADFPAHPDLSGHS